MTQREYIKYNQQLYDMNNKLIKLGDKVVINDHYGVAPTVGIVTHFTASRRVAVSAPYFVGEKYYESKAYRKPVNILVIKRGKPIK